MIIYLNGASSSGKSSIAQALIKLSLQPLEHIEGDDIFNRNRIFSEEKRESSSVVTLYSTRDMIRMAVKAGKSVIWEEPVFHQDELFYQVIALDLQVTLYLIDVYCSLDLCVVRERKRRNRGIGLAKAMHAFVYKRMPTRDITVDSSQMKPEDNARIILDFIQENPEPMAFKNYLQKRSKGLKQCNQ